MADYKNEYDNFLTDHLQSLKIVKTTCTASGQIIDWIPIESQAQEICTPPPVMKNHKPDSERPAKHPLSDLQLPDAEHGPKGTVPIPRPNFKNADFKVPLKDHCIKAPVPLPEKDRMDEVLRSPGKADFVVLDAAAPQPHWYAATAESATIYGCQGTFSAFSPTVATGDFSLIQLAIGRSQGASRPDRKVADPSKDNLQTLEAGWQKYPGIYGDDLMHLFTYFTTVAYNPVGKDFVGGYNTTFKGWVQYDRDLYPACTYSPTSVDGGNQYEMWLVYQLWRGNWWFWCNDRWLGYYPGSMFVSNDNLPAAKDPSSTLADHGDFNSFFGEIFDSTDLTTDSNPTTTDMGSGEFAETRWTHSAYIRNILTQTNVSKEPDGHNDSNIAFNGALQSFNYDPKRYDLENHAGNGGNWGSYLWLGGPGFVPVPR